MEKVKTVTYLLLIAGWLCNPLLVYGQKRYKTEIFYPEKLKSLQVKTTDDNVLYLPLMKLDGNETLEVSFDDLHPEYSRYAYSIIHCNADWKQSDLSPIEYLDGFQDLVIEDFANSIGTTVQYTNYRLVIPNEDIRLKVSGNYAILIYPEGEPDHIVMTVCFSVVDPKVSVMGTVSGNTDVDTYKIHQQIEFTVNTKNFTVQDPRNDLKIRVVQNNRNDNAAENLQPTIIQGNEIVYRNNPALIYKGGNEYRRMEFLSNKYNGMRVNDISFFNPYYHIGLFEDFPRDDTYDYDQDQNGRFYIGCSECSDPATESDYYVVHFTLAMPPLKGGKIYLNGDFVNNNFTGYSEMVYNRERRKYEKSVLLKQGNYNYRYLFVPDGETKGETEPIEGNYHQTENEYLIYVYYRPINGRYDQLIGIQKIQSGTTKL